MMGHEQHICGQGLIMTEKHAPFLIAAGITRQQYMVLSCTHLKHTGTVITRSGGIPAMNKSKAYAINLPMLAWTAQPCTRCRWQALWLA